MNLKLRLILIISLMVSTMMTFGMIHLFESARENITAEISSTAKLVTHLIDAQINYLSKKTELNAGQKLFQLENLSNIRHFRITFYDKDNRILDSNYSLKNDSNADIVPDWFSLLITKTSSQIKSISRDVVINGNHFGRILIEPDPSGEIEEIWGYTAGYIKLLLIFFTAVNFLVYRAVARSLQPIDDLWKALNNIENGNLKVRISVLNTPELSPLANKFNRMAKSLDEATDQNHSLIQQLIRVQEEERKNIARDLHDELGQSMTAIKIEAGNLLDLSRQYLPKGVGSAESIISLSQEMIKQTRELMLRLRPEALDSAGLIFAIKEHIFLWSERHSKILVESEIPDEIPNLGDISNIAIYRILQECLTNISKHSEATLVKILIIYDEINSKLLISVLNDGCNCKNTNISQGFGLYGMRERVAALNGEFEAKYVDDNSYLVRMSIPLDAN